MVDITAADAEQVLDHGQTTTDTIRVKITSLAAAPSKAASETIKFTVGKIVDATIPVATIGNIQTDEDIVMVTFSTDVTAATALNTSNYRVEGWEVF